MSPPEPLQQATAILQNLRYGQYLRMRHRRLPYPLFDLSAQMAIEHCHFPGNGGNWEIFFWRDDDATTAARCRQQAASR